MTHRVAQILEAAAASIRARVEPLGIHVFTHRRRTLAAEQDQFPAISIDLGAETPEGEDNVLIYSSLQMLITACVVAATEPEALEQLIELRAHVHFALMSDYTLGLRFVTATDFAGTSDIEFGDGEVMTFQQTAPWLVRYQMNIQTPE